MCKESSPPFKEVIPGQGVRCFYPRKEERSAISGIAASVVKRVTAAQMTAGKEL
jgi:hypothetical protein